MRSAAALLLGLSIAAVAAEGCVVAAYGGPPTGGGAYGGAGGAGGAGGMGGADDAGTD